MLNLRFLLTLTFTLILSASALAASCRVHANPIGDIGADSKNWYECERDRIHSEDGLKLRAALIEFQEIWLTGRRSLIHAGVDQLFQKSADWQLKFEDRCALVHALLRRAVIVENEDFSQPVQEARAREPNCKIETSIVPPKFAVLYSKSMARSTPESPPEPVQGSKLFIQNGELIAKPRPGPSRELKIDFISGSCAEPALNREFSYGLEVAYASDCVYRLDRKQWIRTVGQRPDLIPRTDSVFPYSTTTTVGEPKSKFWSWVGVVAVASVAAMVYHETHKKIEPSRHEGF